MTKILIVLTGGTIGSKIQNNTINVTQNNYLKDFLDSNFKQINFKIIKPLNILSENSLPSDWNIIIKSIKKNWGNNFDGIIITYGTDTLSYASSAFSQFFYNFDKPVILVSSDKPLKEKNSTGKHNLVSAVNFITKKKLHGTFVAYKNPNLEFVSFFLGSRVKQINPFNNKLDSILGGEFCRYQNNKFFYIKNNINPKLSNFKKKNFIEFEERFSFSNKILIIKTYPGINYKYFNLNKDKPKAILHSLYHSGTTNIKDQNNFSLLNFIEKCRSKKIIFYLSPINKKKNIYQSLKTLLKLKVKILDGMSFESSYAKLSLAYGSFSSKKKIEKFLNKNNSFEKIKF